MTPTNSPPPRKDLTPSMRKALRSFYVGKPWSHLSGRSQFGGSNETSLALHKRGLIDRMTDELTEDGLMECHAQFGHEAVYAFEAARMLDVPATEVAGLVTPVGGRTGFETFWLRDVVEAKRTAVLDAGSPTP